MPINELRQRYTEGLSNANQRRGLWEASTFGATDRHGVEASAFRQLLLCQPLATPKRQNSEPDFLWVNHRLSTITDSLVLCQVIKKTQNDFF